MRPRERHIFLDGERTGGSESAGRDGRELLSIASGLRRIRGLWLSDFLLERSVFGVAGGQHRVPCDSACLWPQMTWCPVPVVRGTSQAVIFSRKGAEVAKNTKKKPWRASRLP